jgi:hypothetical protein
LPFFILKSNSQRSQVSAVTQKEQLSGQGEHPILFTKKPSLQIEHVPVVFEQKRQSGGHEVQEKCSMSGGLPGDLH